MTYRVKTQLSWPRVPALNPNFTALNLCNGQKLSLKLFIEKEKLQQFSLKIKEKMDDEMNSILFGRFRWSILFCAGAILNGLSPSAYGQTAAPLPDTTPSSSSDVSSHPETVSALPESFSSTAQDLASPPLTSEDFALSPATAQFLNAQAEPLPPSPSEPLPPSPPAGGEQPAAPAPAPAGQSPTLQTEPLTPGQLPFKPKEELLQRSTRYSPSITILTPSAYGKSWKQISVGFSFQPKVRYVSEADGALGFGFGLGDARKTVGLDVNTTINDITGFERGTVNLKLHRRLPDQWAIAVGAQNVITWGANDGGFSPYGVVTKGIQTNKDSRAPFSQVYISAGVGTGRYRSEDDVLNDRNTVGAFGSVAVRVVEQVNFITEWSGQDLSLGFSVLPFRKVPIVFTPFVTDVTGTAGDGPRFAFSVGFGYSF
jgi:hypothetical protein